MQQDKNPSLKPAYLWIPLWCGFLALAFILQKHYLSDTALTFNKAATPISQRIDGKTYVHIFANEQGHYIFKGGINKKPVNFLLDTGATYIAIPESVANYLKLRKGNRFTVNTANGVTAGYATLLSKVSVGDIELIDIEAVIIPAMQGQNALLGMSFLKQLSLSQENGEITLSIPEQPD